MMKKIVLEYTLNSSPKVLFPRLSTPGGLSEWFADNVNINGSQYSFFWDKTEQKADIIQRKENKYIRFRWTDSPEPETHWFEFRLNTDELTGDTALIITDFSEDEDKESTIELWNSQIAKLKHVIGL
ncbi:MAG: SRPBCC domain-containing protein [Bacteroidales bacterium]|nr:SRPBCC domain-containing protein [Bacteroidales bacterium]